MTPRLVLALDGGQTSAIAVIGTVDGDLRGSGRGGGIRHIDELDGHDRLHAALTESIRAALVDAAVPASAVEAAYCSLTGGTGAACQIVGRLLPSATVRADSDAIAALASGTRGGPGIGLIAGTGSVAVAVGAGGQALHCGGWGPLLGDRGSGYRIGLAALQAVADADDAIGPQTMLTDLICREWGLTAPRDLFNRVYAAGTDRADIAALAPLVVTAADGGDTVAAGIVDVAVDYLAALAGTAAARADFLLPAQRRIVATGGVLLARGRVADLLVERLARALPDYPVIVPDVPPVIGAFYLALGLAGVSVDDGVASTVIRSARIFADRLRKGAIAPSPHPIEHESEVDQL